MTHHFTRQELYNLVWSQPIAVVAESVGLSNVAVAKACKRANIPVPERGYWARKKAGKPTIRVSLAPRFPGAPDRISFGGASPWEADWRKKVLEEPIPPVPVFDEDIASVTVRARKLVGKVAYRRTFEMSHILITKLLAHDDTIRADNARYGWSQERIYESGAERRRLTLLNSIFLHVQRLGCRPDIRTSRWANAPQDREATISVGSTHVRIAVEPLSAKETTGKHREPLKLTLKKSRSTAVDQAWEDTEAAPLESVLTEIIVTLLVTAEVSYREHEVSHRQWLIGRRADVEEEIRQHKLKMLREAQERRAKRQKAQIERLVGEASDLQRAETIRAYVQAVWSRADGIPASAENIEQWAGWALTEADRIDPIKSQRFLEAMTTLNETEDDIDVEIDDEKLMDEAFYGRPNDE